MKINIKRTDHEFLLGTLTYALEKSEETEPLPDDLERLKNMIAKLKQPQVAAKAKKSDKKRKKLVFAARLALEALDKLSDTQDEARQAFFNEGGDGYEATTALRKVLRKEA